MTQHINLLRSERSEPRDAVQLGAVTVCMVAALLAVALAGWYTREVLARAQVDATSARAARDERTRQAGTVVALDEALLKQLAQARVRLEQLDAVGGVLRGLEASPGEPFSSLFDALSRRTLDGVWLVGLSIDGSQGLTLTARATDNDRISTYLRLLNQESMLRERRFQAMDMRERVAPGGVRIVEFRLSTSPMARSGS